MPGFTTNGRAYVADVPTSPNSLPYLADSHTAAIPRKLDFAGTAAKPTKVFSGVERYRVKATRGTTLTGALTPKSDIIIELSISKPVGGDDEDVKSALRDVVGVFAKVDSGAISVEDTPGSNLVVHGTLVVPDA